MSSALVCLQRLLMAIVVVGFAAPVLAQTGNKDGVEDVKGARWHYEIHKGKQAEKGVFRVDKKVIYRFDKKVGVVHAQGDGETKLEINGLPELNGKATLQKTKAKPPVWTGNLVRKDGTKWKMTVEMRDR